MILFLLYTILQFLYLRNFNIIIQTIKEWKVLPEIQKRPYEQLYKQKSDEYFTAIVKLTGI